MDLVGSTILTGIIVGTLFAVTGEVVHAGAEFVKGKISGIIPDSSKVFSGGDNYFMEDIKHLLNSKYLPKDVENKAYFDEDIRHLVK